MKSGNLNFLEPSGPLQACNGSDLPLPLRQHLQASFWHLHRSLINPYSNEQHLQHKLQAVLENHVRCSHPIRFFCTYYCTHVHRVYSPFTFRLGRRQEILPKFLRDYTPAIPVQFPSTLLATPTFGESRPFNWQYGTTHINFPIERHILKIYGKVGVYYYVLTSELHQGLLWALVMFLKMWA